MNGNLNNTQGVDRVGAEKFLRKQDISLPTVLPRREAEIIS